MPDFSELFYHSENMKVEYEGKSLILGDHISIVKGDLFQIKFEKFNSEWKQGIILHLKGIILVNNQKAKNGCVFWQDTAPETLKFSVYSTKSDLLVYNIWDTGNGVIDFGHGGAAMYYEEIENGRRYFCNDGHPDENFDDIVFTLQKIGSVEE
jgi:hypothetical protein